jgi:hypothetical protein
MGRLSTCSKDITALSNSSIELDRDGLYNSAKRLQEAAEDDLVPPLLSIKNDRKPHSLALNRGYHSKGNFGNIPPPTLKQG